MKSIMMGAEDECSIKSKKVREEARVWMDGWLDDKTQDFYTGDQGLVPA